MKPTSSYAMHHKLCAYLYFVLLSTVMSPSLHADDAVGSIAGELSVTQGQLSWSADITAPSGVNNHTPKLAIQYAHRGDGLLGYGFRLTGLAKITVCQASRYLDGEDRSLEFNDNAKYCYNGKRLVDWSSSQFPASVNTYKLAEDNGLIVVQEGGNHPGSSSWRVLKPTGETLYLGTTQDSQKIVKGENGQSVVSAWYLNTAVDAFDNEINYTYAQLDGTLVLSQVDYDNKRVEMNYERRQSTTSSVEYERGRAQQLNHILESIKVYGDVNKPYMHAYQLTYDTVGVNQRHRLSSITQCSVENRCFPPTQFEWGDQTGESANAQIQTSLEVPMHGLASNLKSLDTEKNPQFADLNADGLNDICVSDMVYNDSRDTSVHLYCATNLGNGEFSKFERWFSRKAPRDNYRDLRLIDVDNDRKADLCYKYLWFGMQDNDKFRERVDYVCYKNAPDKKYNFSQRLLSLPLKSGDITSIADDVRLSDLNNDRVLDACANTGIGKNRKVMCALGSIKNVGLEKHNPIIVGGLNSNAFPTFQDIIQGELLQWDAAKDDMKSPGNNSFAVIDINADGVIDYCAADDNGFSCHLRTGDKTNVQPTHRSVYSNTDIKLSSTTHASFRYVHLNNDHLVDVCFIDDDAYKCAINTGVGFDAPTVWTSDIDAKHVKRQDISMLDVNNDGAADLCRLDRNNQFICAINRGDHFEGYVNYFSHDISVHKDTHASNIFAGDVSGDSKTDVCYVEGNLLKCDISNHDNQSRLSSITSGLGNTATITYGRLDNPQIYSGANDASNHMEDVHGKGVVVSSISKSDGVDGVLTQHYRYSDLRYDWYKKKLSFAQIDVINSTHKTLDRHQFYQSENGDNNSASVAMGLLKSTHTYLLPMADAVSADAIPHDMLSSFPSASLLSEEQLTYTISKPFSSSVTTQILDDTKINIVYADDGRIESRKIFTATDHDKYGKPQKTSTSIDRGSGTSVAKSFKDVLTYKNRVITSGTHWRYYAGLVKSHYKYYNVGGTNNSSHHRRVAAAVNQYGTRGELRFTTEKFSAKSEGLHIEYKYDANGRIEEIIKGDAADLASFIHSEQSRSSTTVYDAFGRVDYTLNALNEKTQYHYDLGRPQCSHAPDEIVDANHHVTKIVYDDFCIKTKETRAGEPSPLSTTWHTTWLNDYPLGHYNPHTAVYKTVEQSDGGNTVTRYYDSYQREIRVETIGFEGKKVYSDKVYDSRGRLAKYTKPYFEGEFAGDNRYWVEHSYDEHNRKIKITDNTQNGQRITKHEYGLGYTKTTDPENKVKETWHHADGTIAKVEEANGESTILHQYNAFGQVVLTNTNGKIVSIEYDAAGRKKKLTDASIGHETYQYNVFGELRKSTDANGVIVRYAYDPLGRMRKQWSEGHDKNINNSWQYGNSQVDHNVGLLVSESSNSSDKTYRYDHLSRLEQVTTSIDGKLFTQTYTYDAFNRANSETMPDGMVVEREYSDIGQLSAVKIPKNKLWDYDYESVEKSIQQTQKKIDQLTTLRERARTRMDFYIAKAAQYHSQADLYEARAEDLSSEIKQLREAADSLTQIADKINNYFDRDSQSIVPISSGVGVEFSRIGTIDTPSPTVIQSKGGIFGWHRALIAALRAQRQLDQQSFDLNASNQSAEDQYVIYKTPAGEIAIPESVYSAFANNKSLIKAYADQIGEDYVQLSAGTTGKENIVFATKQQWQDQVDEYLQQYDNRTNSKCNFNKSSDSHYGVATRLLFECASAVKVKKLGTNASGIFYELDLSTMLAIMMQHYKIDIDALTNRQDTLDTTAEDANFKYCQHVDVGHSRQKVSTLEKQLKALTANPEHLVPIMMGDITVMIPIPEDQVAAQIQSVRTDLSSHQNKVSRCKMPTVSTAKSIDYYRQKVEQYNRYADDSYEIANKESKPFHRYDAQVASLEQAKQSLQQVMEQRASSDETHITVWTTTRRDALNRIADEMSGNGLHTQRQYDFMSGQLQQITTTRLADSKLVRDLRFEYDQVNNVTSRDDVITGILDTYTYDAYSRIDSAQRNNTGSHASIDAYSRDYQYDLHGNMLNNGVDAFTPAAGMNNRLASFKGVNYQYNNNGSLEKAGSRVYTWSALNKPLSISDSQQSSHFDYDANHKRVKQTLGKTGGSRFTYYIGKTYERVEDHGNVSANEQQMVQHKHFIHAEGQVVAIHVRTELANGEQAKPDEMRYLHHDNLGSVDAITDAAGQVIQRAVYDPFGKQTIIDSSIQEPWANRGYTGHEHLQEFNLIHMNGRIYDPSISRFISADPYIQSPTMSQSYNRYAYTMNNPMKYTDPSGYEWTDSDGNSINTGEEGNGGPLYNDGESPSERAEQAVQGLQSSLQMNFSNADRLALEHGFASMFSDMDAGIWGGGGFNGSMYLDAKKSAVTIMISIDDLNLPYSHYEHLVNMIAKDPRDIKVTLFVYETSRVDTVKQIMSVLGNKAQLGLHGSKIGKLDHMKSFAGYPINQKIAALPDGRPVSNLKGIRSVRGASPRDGRPGFPSLSLDKNITKEMLNTHITNMLAVSDVVSFHSHGHNKGGASGIINYSINHIETTLNRDVEFRFQGR